MIVDKRQNRKQQDNQKQTEESEDRYTPFGYALMCLTLSLFLFAFPSYFSLGPIIGSVFGESVGSTAGTVISVACYSGGVIFAFFTASFLSSAFDKHPELKTYLRDLFGGSADAWESALGGVVFVGIALVVHLAAFVVFDLSGFTSVVIKAFVYLFGFMGLVLMTSALDSFIFKPFLRNLSEHRPDKEALSRRAKKVGVAVGSVIVSLATLIAALNELMN